MKSGKCVFKGSGIKPLIFLAVLLLVLVLVAIFPGITNLAYEASFPIEEEAKYFLEFKQSCSIHMSIKDSYLVSKDLGACPEDTASAIIPTLFTFSIGTRIEEVYDNLVAAGVNVSNEVSGRDFTFSWWELFANTPPNLERRQFERFKFANVINLIGEIKGKTHQDFGTKRKIMFSRVIHLISDPVRAIERGQMFCSNEQMWSKVSSVTPFIQFYTKSNPFISVNDGCIRMLMYHWWSWNRVLQQFSDDTYLLEKNFFTQICENNVHVFELNVCKILSQYQNVHPQSSSNVYTITPDYLYKIDCELANRIFYAAIEFGYEYETALKKCGIPEK